MSMAHQTEHSVSRRHDARRPRYGVVLMEAVAVAAGEAPTHRPRTASPVLTDWFLTWAEGLDDAGHEQLGRYVAPLSTSRGTTDQEISRQWLTVEWVLGCALHLCLDSIGAGDHARAIRAVSPVRTPRALAAVSPLVTAAARTAEEAHESWWRASAGLAQPEVLDAWARPAWRPGLADRDPQRAATWGGLADGTREAAAAGRSLLAPATAALGFNRREGGTCVSALNAAAEAFADGVAAIAWSGTHRLVTADQWSWDCSADQAWEAGRVAACSALAPFRSELERTAHDLVARLLLVTRPDPASAPTWRRAAASSWPS